MVTINRIALCPEDGHEMNLLHRGMEMDAWFCGGCGEHRTVLRRGVDWLAEAPLDAVPATALSWIERDADPRHGRIHDEEGG